MPRKLLLCGCFLGLALLMWGVGYASTVYCTGGIQPNCVGPGGYTCNLPTAPINQSVSCSPTCSASGQTPAPPSINLSGSGVCGLEAMGAQKDCPPLFTEVLSINGPAHTTTYTVTVSNQMPLLGFCTQSGSSFQSSTCGANCTCQ